VKRAAPFLFLLLVPVIPFARGRVDEARSSLPSRREFLYLRTGEQVRRMFPGLEGLMASVYWLRAVQYYGHQRAFVASPTYDLLGPLIEITNALDPRMELAYRYGAIFLSEAWPIGAGKPEEGIKVLERGISAQPGSWRLRWDLGGLWFFFLKDDQRAAQVFLEASKTPGAPFWLESLAANVLRKGGHRDMAREIWKQQYEHGGEDAIRDNALFHLQQIDALDASDALSALAARFAERTGRPPTSPRALVVTGLAPRIPPDPTGVPFAYDSQTGRFSIARDSKLWRNRYDR
jgi:hypothetical protein